MIPTSSLPDPTVVLGAAVLVALRIWLGRAIAPPGHEPDGAARRLAYLAGLAIILVALASPLHDLAERALFSAHMLQHLLLTLVAPPLLLYGLPPRGVAAMLLHPGLDAAERRLSRPAWGVLLTAGTLAFWHVPHFYDLAVARHDIHVVEHVSMMVAAAVFWWPVAAPRPTERSLHEGVALLHLFIGSLPGSALGAIITFAPHLIYRAYAGSDASGIRQSLGMDPLVDQQVGGLLMWVPGGLIYLVAMGAILARLLADPPADISGSMPGG